MGTRPLSGEGYRIEVQQGLRVYSPPRRTASGHEILAKFDALYCGLRLRDARLVWMASGELAVWGVEGAWSIPDRDLRSKFVRVARAAYRAHGGEYAPWAGDAGGLSAGQAAG